MSVLTCLIAFNCMGLDPSVGVCVCPVGEEISTECFVSSWGRHILIEMYKAYHETKSCNTFTKLWHASLLKNIRPWKFKLLSLSAAIICASMAFFFYFLPVLKRWTDEEQQWSGGVGKKSHMFRRTVHVLKKVHVLKSRSCSKEPFMFKKAFMLQNC